MGFDTKIQWCHATFNPWYGCQKISPGCDHCYAESWAKGTGRADAWQGKRYRTTPANWKTPLKWNRRAADGGTRFRVFCASLADVFDNEVDPQWRADLWDVVAQTPNLDWLVLTKRIGNASAMFPAAMSLLPNVWLGITVVNQEEADRDVPKLLRVYTKGPKWLSIEPMLGRIDLAETFRMWWNQTMQCWESHGERFNPNGLDWVVVGGESGHHARPMREEWALVLRDECRAAGVAFFMKQLSQASGRAFDFFESFPKHLRVREFPR